MSERFKRLLGGVLPVILASGAPAVWAQQGESILIEEIVVTARKREEDLQSVPLSISAFSGEQLLRQSIVNLQELARHTPGLDFAGTGGVTSDRPVIRGMTQQTRVGDEVNVATFVDGVYTPGFTGTTLLFDSLERVEVIRGPQSAIYGRNSFAGAINYVTKKPSDKLEGGVRGTYGTDDFVSLSGYVSGPIIGDNLMARLDGLHRETGGTLDNAATGEALNDTETDMFRLGLRSVFGENLVLDASIFYQDDEFEPQAVTAVDDDDPRRVGFPSAAGPFDRNRARYLGVGPGTGVGRRAQGELGDVEDRFFLGPGAGGEREAWRATLNIEWQLEEFTLTSLTGYQDREVLFLSNFDDADEGNSFHFQPPPAEPDISRMLTGSGEDRDELSQDLRLVWDQGGAWRWMLGGYYSTEDFQDTRYRSGTPAVINPGSVSGTRVYALEPLLIDTDSFFENDFLSFYGSVDWDISDQLTFSAEARWTKEDKSLDAPVDNFPFNLDDNGDPIPNDPLGNFDDDFDYLTPRFILNWKPQDDVIIYGLAAKGVKSGGFNANAVQESEVTYDTEKNWTYEVGTKLTLLNGSATFNLAGYYVDWDDQQVTVSGTNAGGRITGTLPIIQNVAKSEVLGIELESRWQATEWLGFNLGYAWIDAEYKDAVVPGDAGFLDCLEIGSLDCAPNEDGEIVSTGRLDGNDLQYTSEHSLNVGADVVWPVGQNWSVFGRGDYLYQSKRYIDGTNLGYVPSIDTINLRVGLQNEAWSFEGFCLNVTDDDAPRYGFGSRDILGVPQVYVTNREERRCGLTVEYSFR